MIKKVLYSFLILSIVSVTIFAYNLYLNNKSANWPEDYAINNSLNNSVEWLLANKSSIESNHNSALWWMLKEASDISDNKKLKEFYLNYKTTFLDKYPPNIWTPYFRPYYKPKAPDITEIIDYDEYQIFFIYSLSCDAELASEPVIQKQLDNNFCRVHYLQPRCVTHQLMAVNWMLDKQCGDSTKLSDLSSALIEDIHSELFWDFRVGDAYLQRNLMLASSGRIELIKPVWIERIINAQNPDGGWDDIHPIFTLGSGKIFGLTSKLPAFKQSKSSFHTTAQGIWLMALLQQRNTR